VDTYLPAAQLEQEAEPLPVTKVPAGHATHTLWLAADWYLPAAHKEHTVAAAALYLPAVQAPHEVTPVGLRVTYVPAGHVVQAEEPGYEKSPLPQAVHEVEASEVA